MKNIIPILICLFAMSISKNTFAQNTSIVEESVEKKDKIKRFIAQLDTRSTFIKTNPVSIWGGLIGVEFDKKHQYSLGLYTTFNKAQEVFYTNSIGRRFQKIGLFNIQYLSLGYQYTFFDKHNVLMSVPLEAGFGLGTAKVTINWLDNNILNKYTVTKFSKYVPLQVGYEIEWKTLKWLSIRAQTGYRATVLTNLLNSEDLDINYSGFYYSYGLRIYFGKLYRAIQSRKREKNAKE